MGLFILGMRNILFYLLLIILFTSSYQKAFWYFGGKGFRIFFSDILFALFAMLYLVEKIFNSDLNLNSISKKYLFYNVTFALVIFLNFFIVILLSRPDVGLFIKGLIFLVFSITFQILAIDFISKTQDSKQIYYPLSFVLGGLFSITYAGMQVFILLRFGLDLDEIVLQKIFSEVWHVGIDTLGNLYRVSGLMADANHLGVVIDICISIIIAFMLSSRNMIKVKIYLIIVLPIFLISLIFTFSRSAYMVFFLTTILLTFLTMRKHHKSISKILMVYVVGILCVVILTIHFSDDLKDVFNYKFDLQSEGIEYRLNLVETSLNIAFENIINVLFGVGFNNYSHVFERITGIEHFNAHNDWLNTFIETGSLGFILFFGIQLFITKNAFNLTLSNNDLYAKLGMAYLSSFSAILVGCLFYNFMNWHYLAIFNVLILGLQAKNLNNIEIVSRKQNA
jgi:O-antigen ligase